MVHELDMTQRQLYAHRGASALLPENTLAAFRRGLQDGATALELDVRITADDKVVVVHDADGFRVALEPREIKACTYSDLLRWDVARGQRKDPVARHFLDVPYRMPLLLEVLEAFPKVLLNVDIKTQGLRAVSLVVDLIRHQKAQDRVLLTSFSLQTLQQLQSLRYEGRLGMSRAEVLALYALPKSALQTFNWRNRAAQVPTHIGPFRLDKPEFVGKCHDLGIQVDYWVVNDRVEAAHLWAIGADGIMSDDPASVLSGFPVG